MACELAQLTFSRLGVRVNADPAQPAHSKGRFPQKRPQTIESAFRKEGMDLYTGTRIHGIERDCWRRSEVCREALSMGVKGARREARHIFNALGREPNVESP